MKRQITSLPALACFRVAAEYENFSRAANQLFLTHGAISRAVRLLEDDLGTALFERRNRAVFLTDAGRKLAQAVAHGLDHIDSAAQSIRSEQANAPVTVSCEPTLMMRWLIPRMPGFREFHTGPDVRLVAGGGQVTLGAGIDLAIRRDDFVWPTSYAACPLFDEWIGPVCRPDQVETFFANGLVRAEAARLHSRTRPSAWKIWEGLAGETVTADRAQEFEHFYFSLQAAVAGLGVAIGPWHLVRDDLRTGILSAPKGFLRDGSKYVLLSSGELRPGSAQAAFQEWLIDLALGEGPPVTSDK
jgi:DNA-binding transcriptional LysR family regulator